MGANWGTCEVSGGIRPLAAVSSMRAVDPGSRLSRWRTIAAYGVALAPSLNSFRVGATRTTAAEAIVAPVAIIMAALSWHTAMAGSDGVSHS
jgi:hypothetical protein